MLNAAVLALHLTLPYSTSGPEVPEHRTTILVFLDNVHVEHVPVEVRRVRGGLEAPHPTWKIGDVNLLLVDLPAWGSLHIRPTLLFFGDIPSHSKLNLNRGGSGRRRVICRAKGQKW